MESKLKYYIEIADNAHVLVKQLNRVEEKLIPEFRMLIDPDYIEKLNQLANQIYIQASKIPVESQIEVSLWLAQRKSNEFYNCLLVEIEKLDYYKLLARQLFFDTYNYLFLLATTRSSDAFLKEISEKNLNYFNRRMLTIQKRILEIDDDSEKLKIQEAILDIWKYVPDMFQASSADIFMLSRDKGVNLPMLKKDWEENLSILLRKINVAIPKLEEINLIGKEGQHTQFLEKLIRESE